MRTAADTPREIVRRAKLRVDATPQLPRGAHTPAIAIKITGKGDELPRLVDTRTGESLGICASAAVAQRTKEFFA